MRKLLLVFSSICFLILLSHIGFAQAPPPPPSPCNSEGLSPLATPPTCPNGIPLPPGQFSATPFADSCPNGVCALYGDNDHNTVSFYGPMYKNSESSGNALNHYNQGKTLAANIQPRCTDGTVSTTTCSNGIAPAVVFLFIGFSNCDIEICGGNYDAWDHQDMNPNNVNGHLPGQPCATQCPNLHNPNPNLPKP